MAIDIKTNGITQAAGDTRYGLLSGNLSQFAATTSAQLAGVLSDETGTGAAVFGTSPTIVTPTIASFANATHAHTNAAGGGLLASGALGDSRKVVATQFDATSTTLANVTNLISDTLTAAGTYEFLAVLHVTADVTGGHKYAIAANAGLTATSIIYQVNSINNGTNAFRINSRQTALAGAVGEAVGTAYFTTITGTIVVGVAGTLSVQFAQNSATGTSSVLINSTLTVRRVA